MQHIMHSTQQARQEGVASENSIVLMSVPLRDGTIAEIKLHTGNHGRVARVVLRDVLLDLADQVSTHISSLQIL